MPVLLSLLKKGDVMKTLSLSLLSAGLVAVVAASSAGAFTSREGTKVNPLPGAQFEVVPRAGGQGRDYWCAAGDYAQRALKASWQDRVYVTRGLGGSETTNRRSAAQFTLQAGQVGNPQSGLAGSLNALSPGDNMRVRDAFRQCNQLPAGF